MTATISFIPEIVNPAAPILVRPTITWTGATITAVTAALFSNDGSITNDGTLITNVLSLSLVSGTPDTGAIYSGLIPGNQTIKLLSDTGDTSSAVLYPHAVLVISVEGTTADSDDLIVAKQTIGLTIQHNPTLQPLNPGPDEASLLSNATLQAIADLTPTSDKYIGWNSNTQIDLLDGGSGGGAVDSVFGRTGTVVAASGDYNFAQIGSTPTTLSGYGITDGALNTRNLTAGIGLDGGGDLTADRSFSLDSATQASLALADSATQPADIANFETTTELNVRDTANRNRANHTGTQLISTISDAAAVASSGEATDVTVDDVNFDVLTGTDSQTLWENADTLFSNTRTIGTTGVRFGGIASVDGGLGVGDTVSVTAGAGQILNNTDPENPVFTDITWIAQSTVALTATSPSITFWYFDDNSGVIKQTTSAPTDAQRRTRLYLFRTSYTASLSAITGLASEQNLVQQEGQNLADLANAIGNIKISGSELGTDGGDLTFKIAAGNFFSYASNPSAATSPNSDVFTEFNTSGSDFFRYAIPSGVIGTNETLVNVDSYAPAGVVTTLPNPGSTVGIHLVFRFSLQNGGGNVRVGYGNAAYASVSAAIEALGSLDPLTLVPSTFSRAFLLGAIIARKDETDLSSATFVLTNRFGYFGGSVAIAGSRYLEISNNLSDLSDASAARTNLGVEIGADVQAFDSDLAAIAALTTTAYGRSVLTQADAAALRTLAGLVIGTDVQAFSARLAEIVSNFAAATNGHFIRKNAGGTALEYAEPSASFSWSFTSSSGSTLAVSTTYTFPHGLGSVPTIVQGYFEKITSTEVGWNVNDRVYFSSHTTDNFTGATLWADATNIYVIIASSGVQAPRPSDQAIDTLTSYAFDVMVVAS